MAGFAINLRLLLKHPTARFTYKAKPAYQESVILGRLGVPFREFEIRADNATKVNAVPWSDCLRRLMSRHSSHLRVPYKKSGGIKL